MPVVRSSTRFPVRAKSCRRIMRCSIRKTGPTPPRRRCAGRCVWPGGGATTCSGSAWISRVARCCQRLRDGTPLCFAREKFAREPLAWPKLWKHHGAQAQTDRINAVARQREARPFPRALRRHSSGSNGFFRKCSRRSNSRRSAYEAAEVWLEAGDWFVWQLVGGAAESLPRSTCQAGYKGMWSAADGYPSGGISCARCIRNSRRVVKDKMLRPSPRARRFAAGSLTAARWRRSSACTEGTPVSAAIIDAHAGVPGCGRRGAGHARDGDGHQLMPHAQQRARSAASPASRASLSDGILPGFYGYETGQAAVGDAFDWLRKLTGQRDFSRARSHEAAALPPGAEGVMCVDWFNGCRTPLMDGALKGAFAGLALHHRTGAPLPRAARSFGLRRALDCRTAPRAAVCRCEEVRRDRRTAASQPARRRKSMPTSSANADHRASEQSKAPRSVPRFSVHLRPMLSSRQPPQSARWPRRKPRPSSSPTARIARPTTSFTALIANSPPGNLAAKSFTRRARQTAWKFFAALWHRA